MDKALVSKMLTTNNIEITDLKVFINDYVLLMQNKQITLEELEGILALIFQGVFNLRHALKQAAIKLEMYVMEVWDTKTNILIKTLTY